MIDCGDIAEPQTHSFALHDAQERLDSLGIKALSTTELLAIVLGTSATRDAFHLAERLIQRHNGLLGIAQLGLVQLKEESGISLAKVMQLKSSLELGGRLRSEIAGHRPLIRTPADAAEILLPEMGLLEQEEVRTILLDSRNRVITSPMIYRGSLNSCNMRVGEVFREAIRQNAANLIVAHNHPSGDPSPSSDDIYVTRELVKAGKILGIDIQDHLVVAQNQHVSLKERGLGFFES